MFPLLYFVGIIAGKCDVTHFSDGCGCLNAYFLRIKTAVSRASHGTGEVFCIAPFFVAIPLFWNRCTKHPPPDLSVLKVSASLRPGLIVSDFSGRPGPRAQQDFSKKSPPLKRPCGNRVHGSYFFEQSRFEGSDGAGF